jgi:hypothetical protein
MKRPFQAYIARPAVEAINNCYTRLREIDKNIWCNIWATLLKMIGKKIACMWAAVAIQLSPRPVALLNTYTWFFFREWIHLKSEYNNQANVYPDNLNLILCTKVVCSCAHEHPPTRACYWLISTTSKPTIFHSLDCQVETPKGNTHLCNANVSNEKST